MPFKNPEDKANVCEALRSGRFKQVQNKLHDGVGYCCLGVMLEVLDPEGHWEKPILSKSGLGNYWGWVSPDSIFPMDTSPSDKFLERIGFIRDENAETLYPEIDQLINLNDTQRLSFDLIAMHIEENL